MQGEDVALGVGCIDDNAMDDEDANGRRRSILTSWIGIDDEMRLSATARSTECFRFVIEDSSLIIMDRVLREKKRQM